MEPNIIRLNYLADQFIADTISEQETRELFNLIDQLSDDTLLQSRAAALWKEYRSGEPLPETQWEAMYENITSLPVIGSRMHIVRKWWWMAASVLLLLGTVLYFQIGSGDKREQTATVKPVQNDVLPGKNGAVLTLADGRQVMLDSSGDGIIATQNGSKVYMKNGQLTYDQKGAASGAAPYNTMVTPKGRQFVVSLPDGTKAWLNASSSITYPTVFSGKDRLVKITGEVYFEVVQQKNRPFIVDVDGKQTVQVLGTQFNINSYSDEVSIATTLVEGSIKVSANDKSVFLRPGQQSRAAGDGKELTVHTGVDVNREVAWKNGLFVFNDADIKSVMRQISRWYNVEVVYDDPPLDKLFMGKISRNVPVSKVIHLLELTKLVHFTVDGNTITVTK